MISDSFFFMERPSHTEHTSEVDKSLENLFAILYKIVLVSVMGLTVAKIILPPASKQSIIRDWIFMELESTDDPEILEDGEEILKEYSGE
jgi:hypothetical protein